MILPKPLGSRPIYKNQADFFKKATNRKKLKCPGNGMWTSIPGNKSLYGPPHGTREPPQRDGEDASERGGSTVFISHSPPPLQAAFTLCSQAVHAPFTCNSLALLALFTCSSRADHVPFTHCSRAVHALITCHSRADQVPFTH